MLDNMSDMQDCNIDHCFVTLQGISIPNEAFLFPYVDDVTLEHLCSNYKTVQTCVESSVSDCSANHKAMLLSKTDALEYLCTTGYQGYKNARYCFSNDTLLDSVRECNTTFTSDVSQVNHMQGQTYYRKKEHLCQSMTDLITCIKDSTNSVCGQEASDWIYNIKTRMFSGSLLEVCPDHNNSKLPTVLSITFAVFIAVVVIGLAFLIIYKKIQDEDEHTKLATTSMNKVTAKCSTHGRQSLEPLVNNSRTVSNQESVKKEEDSGEQKIHEIEVSVKVNDSSCSEIKECNIDVNSKEI